MNNNLRGSIYTVAIMTVISRVVGFFRDIVMAGLFGAAASWDSFSIAFEIPNMIKQVLGEGSLSQAFVPVLVEYQNKSNLSDTKIFINSMIGALILLLSISTIIGIIFAPYIIKIIAPGFVEGSIRFTWTVIVLRITFPFLLLSSLTAFSGAVLNSYNCFWVPAISPIFLSIFMIIAAIFFSPYLHISILALAWAVVFAALFQLGFQILYLKPYRLISYPKINFFNPGVRKVFKLMIPAVFVVSIWQINLFLDTFFASYLKVGSISWLYFSDRLIDVPIGIFGMAISTVILPYLSRCYTMRSVDVFSQVLDWAFRCVFIVGIPTAIFFGMVAGPLLSTLFQHGLLNGYAVTMASRSLTAFSIGLVPLILIKILVVGFYAKQDMLTPVIISLGAVILNLIFNLLFIYPLAHAGIALATSLSAIFNSIILFYFLHRLNIYKPATGWKIFFTRLLFANSVLVIWLYCTTNEVQLWICHKWMWRATHLAELIVSSILIYFFMLWIIGLKLKILIISKNDIVNEVL